MNFDPYTCVLDGDTKTSIKIYLFKNVKNVDEIRNNVIKGIWMCAVIKPSLIVDIFQVVVAANRAVLSEKSKTMVTRTVHSEILYNLSLSKKISQSLTKFGIEKENSILLCVLINDEDMSDIIVKEINGDQCPINDLSKFTNINDVKSVYKLNGIENDADLLDIIVSKMVTKSIINH